MEGEGSPEGVKDAAVDVEGGGPPGVVEGCSKAARLELLSGVAGEEPNSDQLKDMMGARELCSQESRAD